MMPASIHVSLAKQFIFNSSKNQNSNDKLRFMGVLSFEWCILIHHFVVPLPLPWGRLRFICGASLSIAEKCYQGYKIASNFALRKPSPRQGKGDRNAVDEDAPFRFTTVR
jgi:hypothetical protein